ncbi:putative UDP-rhamnose:rhamnosyltransferase 1 [Juglans microcarpa x Juglans regia]|uniref:putative UDP-rhamnose:rhamnosyltransferase 1 n=1 Tax=Juglans microcarpa x Juglans regia TaxID=2249226 RepID=UPI001B7F6111|nr:putative UDP-rhamnose:rhamnosyltransferase 1 [Juglans microcarpa x Juglans regia]
MAATKQQLHIAMFPWLAFGHIIPSLELGKLIARRKGHRISFISTPRNIDRLPKIPSDVAPLITLVKLPLPHVDNLPENAEATMDVPHHIIPYLKIAHDGLQEPLSKFLETSNPDWIIHDFAPYWLPPITARLGISRAFFSIYNASSLCFFGPPKWLPSSSGTADGPDPGYKRTELEHFTVPPKWIPFPSKIVYRSYEAKKLFENIDANASGVSDLFRFMMVYFGTEVVAIKTCMEVEAEWLNLFGELLHIPVVPVGLLPPSPEEGNDNKDTTWDTISEWLDKQEKGSVVYVALGSEIRPSEEDFNELALGLEQSGCPFFWALRKSAGGESIELPEGFEERTKGRGIIWTGWAPQFKILGHESVGGFVTHCGWSSVTEAFQFGRALILLPFIGDQGLIARFLEERQAGVEIPRKEEDGSFTRDSVAQTLRLVMKDAEGQIYRDKAREMTTIFGDKELQHRYVDKFVELLENHRQIITKG